MHSPAQPWTIPKLAEVRESLKLSQRKLGSMTGVDPQTISNLERGQSLSYETANKLAPALGLCPHALFLAHNIARTSAKLLYNGYISWQDARADRNHWEDRLNEALILTTDHYATCRATLDELDEIVKCLQRYRLASKHNWPLTPEKKVLDRHRRRIGLPLTDVLLSETMPA